MEVPAVVFEILGALSPSTWKTITVKAMTREDLLSTIRDDYLRSDNYNSEDFGESVFAVGVVPESLECRLKKYTEFEGCVHQEEWLLNKKSEGRYTLKTIEQLS